MSSMIVEHFQWSIFNFKILFYFILLMSCRHMVVLNEFKFLLTIYERIHGNPK